MLHKPRDELNGMEEEELEQKFFLALGILLISDDKFNVY